MTPSTIAAQAAAKSMATMFGRIAWFLEDHAGLMEACGITGDKAFDAKSEELIAEARELRDRIVEMKGEWEKRRHFGDGNNAAAIVADMLREWQVPGSVWYHPATRRFRLSAEGYEPSEGEFCVGVYLPDAPVEMLATDFNQALAEKRA